MRSDIFYVYFINSYIEINCSTNNYNESITEVSHLPRVEGETGSLWRPLQWKRHHPVLLVWCLLCVKLI